MKLTINGVPRELVSPPLTPLLAVLREELGITSPKAGCEQGGCGACTVLVDGAPRRSCLVPVGAIGGAEVTTVEGMTRNGKPHPLQNAFADLGAAQCGYCIPGILLTAKALLDENPHPSRDEIRQALSGNLCRCTGYTKILQAVELAAKEIIE